MAKRENLTKTYEEVGNDVTGVCQSLDRSGSMYGEKYEYAKRALNQCNRWIYDDDSLYSSAVCSYGVFGNQPQLVAPLSVATNKELDFSKYPPNELTSYFTNRIMTGNYALKAIREAQKAGKCVKGWVLIDYTDGAATDGLNESEAYQVTEKLKEKGVITIAVAIDLSGDDCDYDTLNKFNDYVFQVKNPEQLENFMKSVPLQIVKSISQSITGQTFNVGGTTITGTSGIGGVSDKEVDSNKTF